MSIGARFCPHCAAPLESRPPTRCRACGYELYVNPRPTGIVIIVRDNPIVRDNQAEFVDACERNQPEFLAVRRAREPRLGCWALPGGFCDGWEHPAAAAVREAREELGVEVRLGAPVGMYVGAYRHQNETLPVLDCFWLATIVAGPLRLDPAEVSEHAWFALAEPPPLAFETMDRAVRDVVGV